MGARLKFFETGLAGAYVIDVQPIRDERGFFAREWCGREFEERGLPTGVAQCNLSYNERKGTLRGMHWQATPYEESKLVRCTRGAIYDVIIDLRADSSSYCRWFGVELTDDNRRMLFVPANFAHGFQTLRDDTEVRYQVSQFYTPEAERGVRYDDPAFGIDWPLPVSCISAKDAAWPLLDDGETAASGRRRGTRP